MNVDINETRRQQCVAEVYQRTFAGGLFGRALIDVGVGPVFNQAHWILDLLGGSIESACSECGFLLNIFVAKTYREAVHQVSDNTGERFVSLR